MTAHSKCNWRNASRASSRYNLYQSIEQPASFIPLRGRPIERKPQTGVLCSTSAIRGHACARMLARDRVRVRAHFNRDRVRTPSLRVTSQATRTDSRRWSPLSVGRLCTRAYCLLLFSANGQTICVCLLPISPASGWRSLSDVATRAPHVRREWTFQVLRVRVSWFIAHILAVKYFNTPVCLSMCVCVCVLIPISGAVFAQLPQH